MKNKTSLIHAGFSFLCIFWLSAHLSGCATTGNKMPELSPESAQKSKSMEECGIKVIGARLTAAGYMIDFRYRVIDPEKAVPIFDREVKPYLIDQASGKKLIVPEPPKIGALRQAPKFPIMDRNYFVFFGNPGRYLKQGSKVSVVIGDFRAENITLQ